MTSITFDTLKYTKRLEKAGIPRLQAEAQAEIFGNTIFISKYPLGVQGEPLR